MNQKPGVMIYFEMLPTIQNLSKADKAALFEAILEYGMHKTLPPMSAKLKVVWPLVQQRRLPFLPQLSSLLPSLTDPRVRPPWLYSLRPPGYSELR